MIRILLTYVLPLALPTLAYLAWVSWARQRRQAGEEPPDLAEGPWFWLIVAGFVLMVAVLAFVALTGGHDPGGTYRPDRYEDGRVIPGGFEPAPALPREGEGGG